MLLSITDKLKTFFVSGMRSIKIRIIVYFSILFIISLSVFGIIDFNNYSRTSLSENINYTSAIASQFTINLDTYLREAETSLKVLAVNDLVVSSIKNYSINSD